VHGGGHHQQCISVTAIQIVAKHRSTGHCTCTSAVAISKSCGEAQGLQKLKIRFITSLYIRGEMPISTVNVNKSQHPHNAG